MDALSHGVAPKVTSDVVFLKRVCAARAFRDIPSTIDIAVKYCRGGVCELLHTPEAIASDTDIITGEPRICELLEILRLCKCMPPPISITNSPVRQLHSSELGQPHPGVQLCPSSNQGTREHWT